MFSGSEIGNAPDLTFRLQNAVVQPKFIYEGFIPYSPHALINAPGKRLSGVKVGHGGSTSWIWD